MSASEVMVLVRRGSANIAGTAYGIGNGLYLTARHLVAPVDYDGDPVDPTESMSIRLTYDSPPIECVIAWSSADDEFDVALLQVPGIAAGAAEQLRWGRLSGTASHRCDVVGFPEFARLRVESSKGVRVLPQLERVKGTVVLPSGSDHGILAFEVQGISPQRERGHRNPWMGISGAPIYSQGIFTGLVVSIAPGFQDRRLLAVSAAAIAANDDFKRHLEARTGRTIELVDLEEQDPQTAAAAAIQEVARTDPRNIQEVAAAQFGLSDAYYKNVLLQAKRSFAAAVVAACVGLAFLLVAVAAALLGSSTTDAAVVSTIGGSIVEVVAGLNFWLYSRTSTQLNAFHLRLERMQKYLLANSVCANISADRRDEVMADLVHTMAQEPPNRELPGEAPKPASG